MHFAAATIVPESVAKPDLYYGINMVGGYNLLEAPELPESIEFIVSSTAAVYGAPERNANYRIDAQAAGVSVWALRSSCSSRCWRHMLQPMGPAGSRFAISMSPARPTSMAKITARKRI